MSLKNFPSAAGADISRRFFRFSRRGLILGTLSDWLAGQHPGLRTYKTFQEKALRLAVSEAKYRALYCLLANIAGRYVTAYDEKPLPVAVAKQAYEKFLALVKDAEQSIGAPSERQVETLNTVAGVELF
jgi:hypothetical protein